MADHSNIGWTSASWPVTVGCDHASPGCGLPLHDGDVPGSCYAAALTSGRLRHLPEYAELAEGGRFNGTVRCLPERLDWPAKWRKPRRIFVASMSDLFHESVPDEFLCQVFDVMAMNRRHTFQILTKRHARMRSFVTRYYAGGFVEDLSRGPLLPSPFPHVWLGVSVENQQWAGIRIPALMETPAAVRWISAEPLLGPVDLTSLLAPNGALCDALAGEARTPSGEVYAAAPAAVDWVVAGGQSGRGWHPMAMTWLETLVLQCRQAQVPLFVKQDSGPLPGKQGGIPDDWWALKQYPADWTALPYPMGTA